MLLLPRCGPCPHVQTNNNPPISQQHQQHEKKGSASNTMPCFTLRPMLRDAIFAFLCLPSAIFNCLLFVKTVQTIIHFHAEQIEATLTYVVASIAWFITSILSPAVSLFRIYRGRIRTSSTQISWVTLFRLCNPWRRHLRHSAQKLSRVFDTAGRFAEGERVYWDDIPKLNEHDKLVVRDLVEQGITLCKNDTGTEETSPWMLVFSHLVLSAAIMLAGSFAGLTVLEEGAKKDFQVGKELGEWLANYVLLFVGFLQVVSRGGWFCALGGVCRGALCSMTNEEREGLVALYIAMASDTIDGLRREWCYSKVRMNGILWSAPKVRSAVLIALDESFVVDDSNGRPSIQWGPQEETVEVRTVGGK